MLSWVEGVRVMISLPWTEVLVTNCKHLSLSHTMFLKIRTVTRKEEATRKDETIWPASLSEQKLWEWEDKIENVL